MHSINENNTMHKIQCIGYNASNTIDIIHEQLTTHSTQCIEFKANVKCKCEM